MKNLKQILFWMLQAINLIVVAQSCSKQNVDRYQLLKKALNDTTTFFIYQTDGCVGTPTLLGEYLVSRLQLSTETNGKYIFVRGNMTEAQIDSISILYKKRIKLKKSYLRKVPEFNPLN